MAAVVVGFVLLAALTGCVGAPTVLPQVPAAPSTAPQLATQDPGTDPVEDYQPTSADLTALRALMDTRAQAIQDDDRAGFEATVDPRNHALMARQLRFFDNITALPLSSIGYAVDPTWMPPATVVGHPIALHPMVTESVGLAHVTTRPIGNHVNLTFVRRGGDWLVGAETVSRQNSGYDAAQARPWYGAPIEVASSDEVVVLTDRDGPVSAADLLATVTASLARDKQVLDLHDPAPVLFDATSNSNDYAINEATGQQAAALTKPVYGLNAHGDYTRVAGMLIRATPSYIEQLLNDQQTIRHELVHLLLTDLDSWSPTWLVEGIAEYVSTYPDENSFNIGAVDRASLLARTPELPTNGNFGADAAQDYLTAQAAVAFLADHGGIATLKELMATYRRLYAGSAVDLITNKVLHTVYGMSQAQVAEGAWRKLDQFTSGQR